MRSTAFNFCIQIQIAPIHLGVLAAAGAHERPAGTGFRGGRVVPAAEDAAAAAAAATAAAAASWFDFAGTVMDTGGVVCAAEVGTAVFGIARGDCTVGEAVLMVEAALCCPMPDGLTFEQAAVLPSPHVAALSCLEALRPALAAAAAAAAAVAAEAGGDGEGEGGETGVVVLQGVGRCPVAGALAAWLDAARVPWVAGSAAGAVALPPGHDVAAVVGPFDTPRTVAAAATLVRRGGTLVKTSAAPTSPWPTEFLRDVMGGRSARGRGLLQLHLGPGAAPPSPFEQRPDMTFRAGAVARPALAPQAPVVGPCRLTPGWPRVDPVLTPGLPQGDRVDPKVTRC